MALEIKNSNQEITLRWGGSNSDIAYIEDNSGKKTSARVDPPNKYTNWELNLRGLSPMGRQSDGLIITQSYQT